MRHKKLTAQSTRNLHSLRIFQDNSCLHFLPLLASAEYDVFLMLPKGVRAM